MEDKMVELTRFTQVSEAEILANLLKSEGIDCYVRDGFMNQIYNGLDLGGVKVELLEKDLERATGIMEDFGYLSTNDDHILQTPEASEEPDMVADMENSLDLDDLALSEDFDDDSTGYEQKKTGLSRFLIVITILIILLVKIIIILNKYYNG